MLLLVSVAFYGCTKSNYVWVHYDETNCADKWERNVNNEKYKDNIESYLNKKDIKIFEIEIFSDISPDNCSDCTCRSGRRVKCKVKKSDVKDIKREGFYN